MTTWGTGTWDWEVSRGWDREGPERQAQGACLVLILEEVEPLFPELSLEPLGTGGGGIRFPCLSRFQGQFTELGIWKTCVSCDS